MARPLWTFSGTDRALACPASAVLPQAQHVSPPAARGTAIHAFLANVPRLGRDEALAQVPPEYLEACEAIDLSQLPACEPGAWACEVAIAYNVDTGEARELGRDIGRRYPEFPEGERWICGTLDVVGLAADGETILYPDYKSGWGTGVAKAEHNAQLLAGALAACRLWGRKRAVVAIINADRSPPEWDRHVIDDFDLGIAAADFQMAADRIDFARGCQANGAIPSLATGRHCDWCPALAFCPAHLAMARELAVAPAGVESRVAALLTAENFGQAYAVAKQAERTLKAIWEGLEAFARQTPVEVAPGVVYGPRPRPAETLDGQVVRQALAAAFDEQMAKDATEVEATKAALKSAVRKWKERKRSPETLKDIETRALEAIRKAGGAKKTTTYPVMEQKPKAA